jgi:hypothetical protein
MPSTPRSGRSAISIECVDGLSRPHRVPCFTRCDSFLCASTHIANSRGTGSASAEERFTRFPFVND